MPLRNVATNYTFEQQRQEINLLAADVDTLDANLTSVTSDVTALNANLTSVTSDVTALQGLQATETTDSPTFTNLTLSGYLAGPATLTIDPAAVGDNTGTVVIAGNLQVDGTTTTINSTTMTVDDLNITLASGAANAVAANGAGLTVDGASATLLYNGTTDEWEFNKSLRLGGNLFCTNAELDSLNVSGLSTFQDNVRVSATDSKLLVGQYTSPYNSQIELRNINGYSYLYHYGAQTLHIALASGGNKIQFDTISEIMCQMIPNGPVNLYYDNSKKFETTTTGATVTGNFEPEADATRDLGSSSLRWANIYSADLQLSNEGSSNDVDGTWGQYTIQEGEDDLFLINRRSGKKYKFMLQEVQ